MKLVKKHRARLEKMLDELDRIERDLQREYGQRAPHSWRSSNLLDAEALRAVLAVVAIGEAHE